MTIQYLGHSNNIHQVLIDGSRYSFQFNAKNQAISFRDMDGENKIVAKTYKSFKKFLCVPSYQVNDLVKATQNCKIHHA